jgi:hypothetical protein
MFGPVAQQAMHKNKAADRAKLAHDIAMQALTLAEQARTLDLPILSYLLETAALEASAGPGFADDKKRIDPTRP